MEGGGATSSTALSLWSDFKGWQSFSLLVLESTSYEIVSLWVRAWRGASRVCVCVWECGWVCGVGVKAAPPPVWDWGTHTHTHSQIPDQRQYSSFSRSGEYLSVFMEENMPEITAFGLTCWDQLSLWDHVGVLQYKYCVTVCFAVKV